MIPELQPLDAEAQLLVQPEGRQVAALGHHADLARALIPTPAQTGCYQRLAEPLPLSALRDRQQGYLAGAASRALTGDIAHRLSPVARHQHAGGILPAALFNPGFVQAVTQSAVKVG